MNKIRLISFVVALNAAASLGGYGFAQTIDPKIRPDIKRALSATPRRGPHKRAKSYRPTRSVEQRSLRPHKNETESTQRIARAGRSEALSTTAPIPAGTSLSRVLHTSQLSLSSTAGTDEQFFDKDNDWVADQ